MTTCISRVVAASLLIVAAATLEAQAIDCIRPVTNCEMAMRSSSELIVVKVTNGTGGLVPSGKVLFSASAGAVDSAAEITAGIARARWSGVPGNGQVVITASSVIGGSVTTTAIRLGTAATLSASGNNRHWYEKRELGKKINANLQVGIADCTRQAVKFTAFGGGSVYPDTAWGSVNADSTKCVAEGLWRLGDVGEHKARATLVNDPTQRVDYSAQSRTLPWVGLGIMASSNTTFITQVEQDAKLKVTRFVPTAGGTDSLELVYDSTRTLVDTTGGTATVHPVVALDFPIYLPWHHFRFTVGADLVHPTRNWFLGLSLIQLFTGYRHEAVGSSLYLTARFSRRDILRNPDECAAGTQKCNLESETRPVGIGVVVLVNTASVLDKLVTALIP